MTRYRAIAGKMANGGTYTLFVARRDKSKELLQRLNLGAYRAYLAGRTHKENKRAIRHRAKYPRYAYTGGLVR